MWYVRGSLLVTPTQKLCRYILLCAVRLIVCCGSKSFVRPARDLQCRSLRNGRGSLYTRALKGEWRIGKRKGSNVVEREQTTGEKQRPGRRYVVIEGAGGGAKKAC